MVSKAQYNTAKGILLTQQIQSLQSLQSVYKSRLVNFLVPAFQVPDDELYEYIKNTFGAFNKPFQMTAAQLGQAFYTTRRQQAETFLGSAPALEANIQDFNLDGKFDELNPVGLITSLVRKGKETGDIQGTAKELQTVASKSVTNASREAVLVLDEVDTFSTGKVARRARAQGCAFCKIVSAELTGVSEETTHSKFHNNCSCILDASFDSEPKFEQSWKGALEKEIEEAERLIESGEAGTRTVQVGSAEWKGNLKKELSQKARAYRKSRGYNPEKDKAVREAYAKQMPVLVDKIAKGEPLTQVEKNNLHQWGVTGDRVNPNIEGLRQPYAVEMNSKTTKNLAYVLEQKKKHESDRPASILAQEPEKETPKAPEAPTTPQKVTVTPVPQKTQKQAQKATQSVPEAKKKEPVQELKRNDYIHALETTSEAYLRNKYKDPRKIEENLKAYQSLIPGLAKRIQSGDVSDLDIKHLQAWGLL